MAGCVLFLGGVVAGALLAVLSLVMYLEIGCWRDR